MKLFKILIAVLALAFVSVSAQAQYSSVAIPTQLLTVPAGVNGNSGTNASTVVRVGPNGFSFLASFVGTNAATTGNISFAWRVSADGSATNTGVAVYTNVVAATGTTTNRYYGVIPASAINGGFAHLTILNGNDATNRITVQSVTAIAY